MAFAGNYKVKVRRDHRETTPVRKDRRGLVFKVFRDPKDSLAFRAILDSKDLSEAKEAKGGRALRVI